ncbi:MAG: hypothetical protein ACK6DC_11505 [Planctomycetota bacterium]|jgi:hypothetical protein
MARYDDLNTKMIAYWAVLSIVILVLILQGTQALCYNMVTWTESRRTGTELDAPLQAKREQLESLNGYRKERVVDETAPPPAKGQQPATKEVIHIPLDQAQQILLKELSTTKSSGA